MKKILLGLILFSNIISAQTTPDLGQVLSVENNGYQLGISNINNIIGGTATTSPLTFKTTTGIGAAGADHIFQVGNNGGIEAVRILNSGVFRLPTYTTNGIVRATAANGTLTSTGVGIGLTSEVTGVLPLANGGTNNTTGTATINANLTGHVTSVGNAAVLGSFSSSNLHTALTDKQGTGVAVFNTTPTFVTNATIPLVIGGTATTQTLTYRTTTGTGAAGADHIFQVGTNGATEAMRILNSGNIQLGATPTVATKVSVLGTGRMFVIEDVSVASNGFSQMEIRAGSQRNYIWSNNQSAAGSFFGGAGALNLYTGQSSPIVFNTNTAERMRISPIGRVGIGTINPSNNLSVTPLQYNTGTASQSLTTVTGSGTTFTSVMVGSQFVYADGTSSGTITAFVSATELTVTTSQTVTSQAYAIGYTGLQVTSGGSVGIGTTSPAHLLSVEGTIAATSGVRARIRNLSNNAATFAVLELGNDANAVAGGVFVNSSTNTANYGGANSLNLINFTATGVTTIGTNNLVRINVTSAGVVQLNTYTTNGIVRATAANGTLTSSGVGIGLTTEVTGVLPIANGGTNIGTIGGAGTITYSNGTQHVSTAVGTSGQVLTSAGAGAPTWITLGSANIYEASASISSAQLLSGNTTPINIISAPGAGKYIEVISAVVQYTFGGTAYAGNRSLLLINSSAAILQAEDGAMTLSATASGNFRFVTVITQSSLSQMIDNNSLQLKVAGANPTAGNGTAIIKVLYRIVTI